MKNMKSILKEFDLMTKQFEPGTVYSNSKDNLLVLTYSASMNNKHKYALLDYFPNEPMPFKVYMSSLSKEKLLELLKLGGYEFNSFFTFKDAQV